MTHCLWYRTSERDIELITRKEIPYLRAPLCFPLLSKPRQLGHFCPKFPIISQRFPKVMRMLSNIFRPFQKIADEGRGISGDVLNIHQQTFNKSSFDIWKGVNGYAVIRVAGHAATRARWLRVYKIVLTLTGQHTWEKGLLCYQYGNFDLKNENIITNYRL